MARDGVAVGPELAGLVARRAEGERFDVVVECGRLGVSTTTFYKYLKRFEVEGVDGFFPRSRRPLMSSTHVSSAVEDLVCRARKELIEEGWDSGADSIRFRLLEYELEPAAWPAGRPVPARATINRILERGGQLPKVPQRRPRRATRRFRAENPNGRWQIDGFQHKLSDKTVVVVLQIVDDCSGLDIGLWAICSENSSDAWECFTRSASSYGLPAQLLSDNGLAFSGRRRGWITPMEANLDALGVRATTTSIGHPQTNGKCERAHRTVQQWLARRSYPTLEELQAGLDEYRVANNNRRRVYLDGLTPQQRYDLGPIEGPTGLDKALPLIVTRKPTSDSGNISINGHLVGLGRRWSRLTLTVVQQGNQVTVFHDNQLIVEFEATTTRKRYQSVNPRAKVSAKS